MEGKDKNNDGAIQVNESLEIQLQPPELRLSHKRIIFSTLEEQEEENYHYWLRLTPEQRLENVTFMIKTIYARELEQPSKSNRIFFDEV